MMASIPGLVFVIVGVITAAVSIFGDEKMVLFVYIGIGMIAYGLVKMYVLRSSDKGRFCQRCGRERLVDARFCHHCGAEIRG